MKIEDFTLEEIKEIHDIFKGAHVEIAQGEVQYKAMIDMHKLEDCGNPDCPVNTGAAQEKLKSLGAEKEKYRSIYTKCENIINVMDDLAK